MKPIIVVICYDLQIVAALLRAMFPVPSAREQILLIGKHIVHFGMSVYQVRLVVTHAGALLRYTSTPQYAFMM
jgi:hypothetical protein